jgi:hypothetical protein
MYKKKLTSVNNMKKWDEKQKWENFSYSTSI